MPGGKDEAGSTESEISTILPVSVEMTIVASPSLSPITARHEANTVMFEATVRWAFVLYCSLRPDAVARGASLVSLGLVSLTTE